jgi:hypothetical protein
MSARMSAADYRREMGQAPPGSDLVRFKSESQFQAAVVSWWDSLLLADPVYLLHVPNGGKRDRVTAAILQSMGVRPGVADLGFMLPRARMAWLELKVGDGKPSQVQKDFAARCKRLAHPYAVARTFDEVVAALASFGVRYREPVAARLIREGL